MRSGKAAAAINKKNNENRSFMAKSGEEQISPSASFPVCTSLWLEKKEAHAKRRQSQSLSVSIPICAHFMIVRPSSRACRAATVNSLF